MSLSKEYGVKWKDTDIIFHPIGIIHSDHTEHENTPIQGIFNPSVGYIEVFDEFKAGLADVESFSHIYAFYYFHRATGKNLVQKPFLDGENKGEFLPYVISIGQIRWVCRLWSSLKYKIIF